MFSRFPFRLRRRRREAAAAASEESSTRSSAPSTHAAAASSRDPFPAPGFPMEVIYENEDDTRDIRCPSRYPTSRMATSASPQNKIIKDRIRHRHQDEGLWYTVLPPQANQTCAVCLEDQVELVLPLPLHSPADATGHACCQTCWRHWLETCEEQQQEEYANVRARARARHLRNNNNNNSSNITAATCPTCRVGLPLTFVTSILGRPFHHHHHHDAGQSSGAQPANYRNYNSHLNNNNNNNASSLSRLMQQEQTHTNMLLVEEINDMIPETPTRWLSSRHGESSDDNNDDDDDDTLSITTRLETYDDDTAEAMALTFAAIFAQTEDYQGVDAATAATLHRLGVQSCPRCGALVERTGGCAAMQCRCGARWCWICNQTGRSSTATTTTSSSYFRPPGCDHIRRCAFYDNVAGCEGYNNYSRNQSQNNTGNNNHDIIGSISDDDSFELMLRELDYDSPTEPGIDDDNDICSQSEEQERGPDMVFPGQEDEVRSGRESHIREVINQDSGQSVCSRDISPFDFEPVWQRRRRQRAEMNRRREWLNFRIEPNTNLQEAMHALGPIFPSSFPHGQEEEQTFDNEALAPDLTQISSSSVTATTEETSSPSRHETSSPANHRLNRSQVEFDPFILDTIDDEEAVANGVGGFAFGEEALYHDCSDVGGFASGEEALYLGCSDRRSERRRERQCSRDGQRKESSSSCRKPKQGRARNDFSQQSCETPGIRVEEIQRGREPSGDYRFL